MALTRGLVRNVAAVVFGVLSAFSNLFLGVVLLVDVPGSYPIEVRVQNSLGEAVSIVAYREADGAWQPAVPLDRIGLLARSVRPAGSTRFVLEREGAKLLVRMKQGDTYANVSLPMNATEVLVDTGGLHFREVA
jgi:hypothetical protein